VLDARAPRFREGLSGRGPARRKHPRPRAAALRCGARGHGRRGHCGAAARSTPAAQHRSVRADLSLLDQWAPQVAPKTPLGQAITYARNRRIELGRFFEDGRIALDNGEVERLIRVIATMRKNSLFVGSDAAGHRAAIVLSLVVACYRIDLDPWAYFRDILPLLGASRFSASRLPELLPAAWREQQAKHLRAQLLASLLRAAYLDHDPSVTRHRS